MSEDPTVQRPGTTDDDVDVTQDESSRRVSEASRPIAGVVAIFSGEPTFRALPLRDGKITLGRCEGLDDDRMSREHAEVSYVRGQWTIRDLGSRNGTSVDGRLLGGSEGGAAMMSSADATLVRTGNTLHLLTSDLRDYGGEGVVDDAYGVAGPRSQAIRAAIDRIARTEASLLVIGESGTGKELAARRFHASTDRSGAPFIAVNCAAIPESIAERVLFGAKRGAYSGANVDAPGHVQAADGGVLFLDEVGELALEVQAKLLRFIETREVTMLGAAKPTRADVRLVFATHRDLRGAVADGRFRADLYYRVATPEVRLPPLRARAEEIPWLVARAAASIDRSVVVGAKFVEAVLLRPWPGNVRELVAEVRRAAGLAMLDEGRKLRPEHLGEAGRRIERPSSSRDVEGRDPKPAREIDKAAIEAALAAHGGRVAATARSLGLHRTQLYRLLERHGITTRSRDDDES